MSLRLPIFISLVHISRIQEFRNCLIKSKRITIIKQNKQNSIVLMAKVNDMEKRTAKDRSFQDNVKNLQTNIFKTKLIGIVLILLKLLK